MNERVIYPSSVIEGYEREIVNSTHAGFGLRLVAYLIDLIVIWSIKMIILHPIVRMFNLEDKHFWIPLFSVENIGSALVYFLYFVLMTWFFRATLGKMLLGLKVISYTRDPLTFGRVVTREFFGRYISDFIKLLYVVILFNPKKQGIHDMLADTIVVKERDEQLRHRMIDIAVSQNNSL